MTQEIVKTNVLMVQISHVCILHAIKEIVSLPHLLATGSKPCLTIISQPECAQSGCQSKNDYHTKQSEVI